MNTKNTNCPIRTAFYIRVSTEEQDEKYGKDLQRTALDQLVASKAKLSDDNIEGYLPPKPEHIYMEDISGTKPIHERSEMSKLYDALVNAPKGEKPFDAVFVFKLDRLARKLKVLLEIVEFLDGHNVQIVSARENIDTSTPFGRAMLGILGVIAELEIETIKDRTHSGKLAAVMKGVLMQDKYGYDRHEGQMPTINEEEALYVKRIFESFVQQRFSLYEIAKQLTEDRISNPLFSKNPTKFERMPTKNPFYFWSAQTVRNILKDEIYIGNYYYAKTKGKKVLEKEKWVKCPKKLPDIIDLVLFEKAQELLTNTNRTIPKDTRKTYLLRGLLKCDDCYDPEKDIDGRVSWHGVPDKRSNGKVSYYYKCRRRNVSKGGSKVCRMIPLPASDIENYVVSFVKDLLKNPKDVFEYQNNLQTTKLEVKHLSNKRQQIEKSINSKPAIRDNLKEQHSLGLIPTEKLIEKLDEIDIAEKSLKEALYETDKKLQSFKLEEGYVTALSAFAKKYEDNLEELTPESEDMYTILHMIIEEIVVLGRPKQATDTLSGKKKEDQVIPNKLYMKLRLPQKMFEDLVTNEKNNSNTKGFEVKNSIW